MLVAGDERDKALFWPIFATGRSFDNLYKATKTTSSVRKRRNFKRRDEATSVIDVSDDGTSTN